MKSIIVYEFMIRDLKLQGIKLLLYALIYSFSQFGQGFFCSDKVVCSFLGISRSQYYACRKLLLDEGFIYYKGDHLYTYSCSLVDEDLEELIRIAKTPWVD